MAGRWRRLDSVPLGDYRIFSLRRERYESPRNGHTIGAVVLDAPDWVNVIALSDGGECVMIRQFRFGTDSITLEIPGGMIDAGEAPLDAAVRELREETGHTAERWTALGSVAPNPAFARNRLHTFLAEGCRRVGELQQDESEDIEVVSVPVAEIDGLIARGMIEHALVVVAFHKLQLLQRGLTLL